MKDRIQTLLAPVREIFGFESDESKGRLIALSSTLLTTFYNVFITGIFHTGFLSMYGMSITDTGILTFIPFLANLLSIFSPKILGRFRRRKKLLLTTKTIFYFIYIVAATMMPQFVHDPRQRLLWFAVIQGVAHGFYALFSSGLTTWFYNFYPADNDQRIRYLTLSQIFASILSSIILLSSSFLTDALSGSPAQNLLILIFRYGSFGLVLLDVFIQSKAKEYPYAETAKIRLTDVFTLPLRHKKFLLCMIFMFVWNFIANLNNGLWNYHLLNHMGFSYTLINTVSVMYTVILMLLSPFWRKLLARFSWIKTFGIATLLWVPTEFIFFFMTPERSVLFVPTAIMQHIMAVGLNLAYANVLYLNLPDENSTAYVTFNTVGCNVFAFFGLITGTWVSAFTGDATIPMLGMDVYSVQFTTILRGVFMLILSVVLIAKWRDFTPERDIEDVMLRREYHRQVRAEMKSELHRHLRKYGLLK